jgi:hypothetical protein
MNNHDDYARLVGRCALRFHEMYGGCFEDIRQNAWVIFLECRKTHDPARGKLSTWAWHSIFNRLRHNRMREFRILRWETVNRYSEFRRKQTRFDTDGFFSDLSEEARTVARILFEAPYDFHELRMLKKFIGRARRRTRLPRRNVFAALREIGAALV